MNFIRTFAICSSLLLVVWACKTETQQPAGKKSAYQDINYQWGSQTTYTQGASGLIGGVTVTIEPASGFGSVIAVQPNTPANLTFLVTVAPTGQETNLDVAFTACPPGATPNTTNKLSPQLTWNQPVQGNQSVTIIVRNRTECQRVGGTQCTLQSGQFAAVTGTQVYDFSRTFQLQVANYSTLATAGSQNSGVFGGINSITSILSMLNGFMGAQDASVTGRIMGVLQGMNQAQLQTLQRELATTTDPVRRQQIMNQLNGANSSSSSSAGTMNSLYPYLYP